MSIRRGLLSEINVLEKPERNEYVKAKLNHDNENLSLQRCSYESFYGIIKLPHYKIKILNIKINLPNKG